MIAEICLYGCFIWLTLYLILGYFMVPWDVRGTAKGFVYMTCWIILPMLVSHFREIPVEPEPIEGICQCKRRFKPGEKYCSVCGGKIKDKLWKRTRN